MRDSSEIQVMVPYAVLLRVLRSADRSFTAELEGDRERVWPALRELKRRTHELVDGVEFLPK